MSNKTVRVPPVPVEQFSDEQSRLVGNWKHLIFSRVLVNSPRMYRTFVTHLEELVARTNLPPRDRQIVCLRMLERCNDVYEKTHHITISRKTGLTDQEITAILEAEGACLTEFDKTVLNATDELFSDQCISDVTWEKLAQRYSQQQLMEIVFLAGCYQTMAMLTKSFGMQLEPDLESFNVLRKYA
jgi:4-carboxymuconolactone decarboxylase